MIYKHKDVSANINSDDINIGDIGEHLHRG